MANRSRLALGEIVYDRKPDQIAPGMSFQYFFSFRAYIKTIKRQDFLFYLCRHVMEINHLKAIMYGKNIFFNCRDDLNPTHFHESL